MAHGVLKKFACALLFIGFAFAAAAQTDSLGILKSTAAKPAFHVLLHAGLVAGDNGRDVLLQVVPGVQYKTWFLGIGSGPDYYYLRSVPLFVSLRKTFSKPHIPFIYANVGRAIPWIRDSEKSIPGWYNSRFNAGLYYDVGAGWIFSVNKRQALLLSAGLSAKQLEEVQKLVNIPPGANEELYTSRISYNLHYFSFKVGFQF